MVVVEVEEREVGVGSERRQQVALDRDSLRRELAAQLLEELVLTGEALEQLLGLLPLLRLRIGLEREQQRDVGRHDRRHLGGARGGGVLAPATAGEQYRRDDGEQKCDEWTRHRLHPTRQSAPFS